MSLLTEDHLAYCKTERQKEIALAVISEGSNRKAAKLIECSRQCVDWNVNCILNQASIQGWSADHDMDKPTPETHHVKGTSTLYDGDGKKKLQWVKTNINHDALIKVSESLAESFARSVKPFAEVPEPTIAFDDQQQVAYVIADVHLGMYAWAEETGDSYDCEIASNRLTHAMRNLINRSPDTETAIIAQLGDYIHITDETNQTPRGKNQLDVDTRWKRVVNIGIELYKQAINLALEKHRQVTVYNVRGNHDYYTAYLIGMALKESYRLNSRVTIVNDASDYFYHSFGSTFIQLSHGHLAKPATLGEIMMADRRREVGESDFVYSWSGHVHHESKKDFGWYTHESFATLASNDAHAAALYRSGRTMDAVVLDREFGICGRQTVCVQELKRGES